MIYRRSVILSPLHLVILSRLFESRERGARLAGPDAGAVLVEGSLVGRHSVGALAELLLGDALVEASLGVVAAALLDRTLELVARELGAAFGQVGAAEPVVRLGKIRLNASSRLEVAGGVVDLIFPYIQQRPTVARLPQCAAGADRFGVCRDRLVVGAALLVQLALEQERLRIARAVLERLIQVALGLVELADRELRLRAAKVGLGIILLQLQRARILVDRAAGVILAD